jgi:hypothetical protein
MKDGKPGFGDSVSHVTRVLRVVGVPESIYLCVSSVCLSSSCHLCTCAQRNEHMQVGRQQVSYLSPQLH